MLFKKGWIKNNYGNLPLSRGFTYLYAGKTIVMIASAMLGLFLPIFLYEFFDQNLQKVLLFYGVGFLSYGVLIVFTVRFLNKYGFRRALQTSVLMGMAYYVVFYFLNQENMYYLIPLALLFLLLFRLTYWIPYHVDFAKFTNRKTRGRQISAIWATQAIFGISLPFFSGFMISRFGFDVLFLIAILLFFASGIPYLAIPRTREKYRWKWKRTWREFFSQRRRKVHLAHAALGAENLISLTVWPIFIFQLLEGNYFQVGAVSTLIIGATALIQFLVGRHIDIKGSGESILKWGSLFYAFGWIIKIFISTAFQIFLVGAYHSITGIFAKTPFDVLSYEIAADQEHYVDEYTVLREMSIQFGRVVMIIFIILFSFILSLQWIFILAAGAALGFNLLKGSDLLVWKR